MFFSRPIHLAILVASFALFARELSAQYAPQGWIQGQAWNLLLPLGNPGSCSVSSTLGTNWQYPLDIRFEDPKAGTTWNIDFASSPSSGWGAPFLGAEPVWIDAAYLEEVYGLDAAPLVGNDIVDAEALIRHFNEVYLPSLDLSYSPAPLDNVTYLATTYVENLTGAPLAVHLCTSSDDSLKVWVNDRLLLEKSVCRGINPGCDERSPTVLPPGVSRIAIQVWEGIGAWGHRMAIDHDGVRLGDGNGLVEFLGPSGPDTVGQNASEDLNPLQVRRDIERHDFDCSSVAGSGEAARVTIRGTASKLVRWDFTAGLEGWSATFDVANLQVTPDGLEFDTTGVDPWITSNAVDYPPTQDLRMTVRMRSTADAAGQLFYGQSFSEQDSVRFAVNPDGQWHQYEIALPPQGPGTLFRLDPATAPGHISLAWICVETTVGRPIGSFLELGDMIGGGDGTGTAPDENAGIDIRNGQFVHGSLGGRVQEIDPEGDLLNPSPVVVTDFIDSVFFIGEFFDPDPQPGDVVGQPITDSGIEFDFPSEDAFGAGWEFIVRDAPGGLSDPGGGNSFTIGGQTFTTAVGVHASSGVTFDLRHIRAVHGDESVGTFSAFAGMDDCSGDINLHAILSGDTADLLDAFSVHNITANTGEEIILDIPDEAEYLTLATGSNGPDGCDHGTFAAARIFPKGSGGVGDVIVVEEIRSLTGNIADVAVSGVSHGGIMEDVIFESGEPGKRITWGVSPSDLGAGLSYELSAAQPGAYEMLGWSTGNFDGDGTASALLVAGDTRLDFAPGAEAIIIGPTEIEKGGVASLAVLPIPLPRPADPIYHWEVEGPGRIVGPADGEEVDILGESLGVLRVVFTFQGLPGCYVITSATELHVICPPGGPRCESLDLSGPEGRFGYVPGQYTVSASARADAGKAVLYTFSTSRNDIPVAKIGPQPKSSATFDLGEGTWEISVTVDDGDIECDGGASDSICSRELVVWPAGQRQRPGDCNQDGRLDISDAICVFGHLFLGDPRDLPCETTEGDRLLLDWNDDGLPDMADGVATIVYLFEGGSPHVQGKHCAAIPYCPQNARCE